MIYLACANNNIASVTVEPISLLNQDSSSDDPLSRICASTVDHEFQTRIPVVIPAVSVITSGIFLLLVISVLVYAIVYYIIRRKRYNCSSNSKS